MPTPTGSRPGPLVAPIAELTEEQLARAARQLRLPGFGELAQRRLRAAKVLVIGAGGLGSATIPYLVGAGVGEIGVVDDDRVELSNLHRQIAHGTADIGRAKTDSLADAARRLDPGVAITTHRLRLTAQNALEVIEPYDLVIDGSDNFPTRYLVNDAVQLLDKPLVWGAILQYQGQVGVAWHRHGPGYRDLFPRPPAPEDAVSCESGGVLPGLCGTIGSLLATEAMKVIAGVGDLLVGRVLLYDALSARTRELPYERDPQTEPVTELIDYELFCAGPSAPPELTAAELAERLRAGERPRLIDVRTPFERSQWRIAGSEALPLAVLETTDASLDGPAVVYCLHEPRAIRAAKLLMDRGCSGVTVLRGGIHEFASTAPEFVESGAA